jgi:hypothetical protein
MLDNNYRNQTTTLQNLSDIPGISELDDRAAESLSGGYRVAFYSGKNGTGKIVHTSEADFKSIRGRDGGDAARIGEALSFRITGGPKGSQYRLTTNTERSLQGDDQVYTGFTHRAVNLNDFDKMFGILAYEVNRIK